VPSSSHRQLTNSKQKLAELKNAACPTSQETYGILAQLLPLWFSQKAVCVIETGTTGFKRKLAAVYAARCYRQQVGY
jgi:hypothetical protein